MTTERKLAQAADGVNGIAAKVLAAVPIQERWTREQICGELRRQGMNVSPTIAHGCLDTLRARGLVREPEKGIFYRVVANARPVAAEVEPPVGAPKPASVALPPAEVARAADGAGPIDRLGLVAGDLRGLAGKLTALADLIDSAALDALQSLEDARSDGGKLAQLREVLRNL